MDRPDLQAHVAMTIEPLAEPVPLLCYRMWPDGTDRIDHMSSESTGAA